MTRLTWIKCIFLTSLIAIGFPAMASQSAFELADATSVVQVEAVNINVADAKTLSKSLTGVGSVRANAIESPPNPTVDTVRLVRPSFR